MKSPDLNQSEHFTDNKAPNFNKPTKTNIYNSQFSDSSESELDYEEKIYSEVHTHGFSKVLSTFQVLISAELLMKVG